MSSYITPDSWSICFETSEDTLAYETVLTETCGVLALSVSRPYLDAPYWLVEGFCDEAPDENQIHQALTRASLSGHAPSFEIIAHGQKDWLAENRASFPALHIGRFWIHGAHITQPPPFGARPLHVEAAEAFGSGTHPTTEGCLRLLDRLLQKLSATSQAKHASALDLGAGSAILAMAVLKIAPRMKMIASDIDPIATKTATGNRRLNGIAPAQMRCVTSKGFAHRTLSRTAPYDILIANILAGPLKQLAPDIARRLSQKGHLILSGILTTQERQIRAAYRANGLVIKERVRIGEWSALHLVKLSKMPKGNIR